MNQKAIDKKNKTFWDEPCGTNLANTLKVKEITPENLSKFDTRYLKMYPYLEKYIINEELAGKKLLEIGLGYGTLSQLLASSECNYHGLDIAETPVKIVHYRLHHMGQKDYESRVQVGSALDIPFANETFDFFYSIGCLHHTGDIAKSISEVYRVLKPKGKAIIMLYHKNSFRQRRVRWKDFWAGKKRKAEDIRAMYDYNQAGEIAPHTDYVSKTDVKNLFANFSQLNIDVQNFDNYHTKSREQVGNIAYFLKLNQPREKFLNNIARWLGLDLYITAIK